MPHRTYVSMAARLAGVGLLWLLVGGAMTVRAADLQPTLSGRLDAALDTLAAELPDAAAARARIAQDVALEAYEGVLKGARGTYLTAGGNSADQALLLEDLIRRRQPQASLRFATCELDDAAVQAEWTALAARTEAVPAPSRGEALAAALPDPVWREAVTAFLALHATALQEQREAAAYLAGGLATAAYAPRDPAPGARATLRHHVWLQEGSDGNWRDLDTTTADGAAPCTAGETSDALPDSAFRTLRIQLIVERRSEGALAEEVLLDSTMNVADIATARVAFGFGEAMGLNEADKADPQVAVYTPLLRVDNVSVVGTPVKLPPPDSDIVVGMADAIGGIGDDAPADPAAGDGVTGAWLSFTFAGPGNAMHFTSEVFDRLGPAFRRSPDAVTAALAPLEVAGGDYAAIDALWQIAVTTGPARGEAAMPDASLDLATLDGLSGLFDGLLRLYPALRQDLGGRPDAAAGLLLGGLVPFADKDGAAGFRVLFDAVHAPVWSAADTVAAAADAAAIPAAEQLLAALAGETLARRDNAGSVLAVARAAGRELRVLAPGTEAFGEGSADARARIGDDLAGGKTVVVPASPVRMDGTAVLAWWTIEPASGLVRDRHENGRHSETVEYETTNVPGLTAAERFRRFACKIVLPLAIAGSAVFAITGGEAGGSMIKAAVKIATAADETRKKGQAATKIACMGTGGQGAP
jgi:hypothetical protein